MQLENGLSVHSSEHAGIQTVGLAACEVSTSHREIFTTGRVKHLVGTK